MGSLGFVKDLVPFNVAALQKALQEGPHLCAPVTLNDGSSAMAGRVRIKAGSVTFCSSCGTVTGRSGKRATISVDGVRTRLKAGQAISVPTD